MVARHCQMGKWSWHLVNQPMLQQGWDTTAVFNVDSDGHLRTSTYQLPTIMSWKEIAVV